MAVLGVDTARVGPSLLFSEGVPQDVRALAAATWRRFTEALPARRHCLVPVEVAGTWEGGHRASYNPWRRVVTVRMPAPAATLAATLVHEFAHHLEFTCPDHRALRPAFLRAQGRPPGTEWFEGTDWEAVPSEQFAEAMVAVVLDRPPLLRVRVRSLAVGVVRARATGR